VTLGRASTGIAGSTLTQAIVKSIQTSAHGGQSRGRGRLHATDRRASADTPEGPSLGLGEGAIEAVEHALEPFEGIVDELPDSLPNAAFS
jgi:hypothetical protein